MDLANLYLLPREKYVNQQSVFCNRCDSESYASKETLEWIDNAPDMLCGGQIRVPCVPPDWCKNVVLGKNPLKTGVKETVIHIRVVTSCRQCNPDRFIPATEVS